MRSQLALDDAQVKRLEALGSTRPERNDANMLRARADMMEAMRGEGNLRAARAAMDRMHTLQADEQIGRLKARQDARAVLTPAQRGQADRFAGAMRGRARGKRHAGVRRDEMNRDGRRRDGINRERVRQKAGRRR